MCHALTVNCKILIMKKITFTSILIGITLLAAVCTYMCYQRKSTWSYNASRYTIKQVHVPGERKQCTCLYYWSTLWIDLLVLKLCSNILCHLSISYLYLYQVYACTWFSVAIDACIASFLHSIVCVSSNYFI